MGTTFGLPLSDVVDVTVNVSPQLPATPTFNQGLIVGSSPVIPSVIGNGQLRCRLYSSLTAIAADGFGLSTPEYIAAQIYFSQSPAPQYLWIGRQDLTAVQTIGVTATHGGTGWAVGDKFNIVQGGGQLAVGQVTAETGGVVSGVSMVPGELGTGYVVQGGNTTTAISPSVGAGLEVDILTIGETPLQAVQACRLASPQWWAFSVVSPSATDTDNVAIAEWAQAALPQCMLMYTTSTLAVINGTAGNIMATLKTGNYNRAFGIYATTQAGAAPNNIYAAVAAMGVAMGLNTGLANSYFTMKFKTLVGITPEDWTESQKATVEGQNGNIYVNYGNAYNWLEQGVVANGQFFDEILNLDMLGSDYQYSLIDALVSSPSIGQNESGQTQLLNIVDQCNARAANRGFIAAGTWTGATILNLVAGASLPNGYLSQSPAYTTQSASDRQARKSMPIYVAIIEAGAIHSIVIGVYVQK